MIGTEVEVEQARSIGRAVQTGAGCGPIPPMHWHCRQLRFALRPSVPDLRSLRPRTVFVASNHCEYVLLRFLLAFAA